MTTNEVRRGALLALIRQMIPHLDNDTLRTIMDTCECEIINRMAQESGSVPAWAVVSGRDNAQEREALYAQRDTIAQGDYFVRHMSGMTGEGLHAKSDIAAELAHRDMEIDLLRAALDAGMKEIES